MRTTIIDIDQTRGPLVRWGAIFAGAVWGLAVMAVLSSLWLALAYPSNSEPVRESLEWFIAGSGAFALLVAGLIAGSLADNRGAGSGLLHGMTSWALLLITTLVFGLPSVFALFNVGQLRTIEGTDLVGAPANDALWATFLTLVIGAGAAAIGGVIGGASRRGVTAAGNDIAPRQDDIAPRQTEAAPMTADLSADRVMVRRADDGSFVDQEGRRYVPEEVPSGSTTTSAERRTPSDVR